MVAKQSVYLNRERDKALPEGHEDAKFLLVRAGQEVAEADLDRYEGVADLAEADPEEKEPVVIPPPNLKEHGEGKGGQSIPAPKIKGDKEVPDEGKKPAAPKKVATIKKPRRKK